jgi:2-keto-4-pentenoate hydratase/2-oxohepta-3-ene-1,7-dioic acid hydratase in catechol pathway
MRFISFRLGTRIGLAVRAANGDFHGLTEADAGYPGDLQDLLKAGPAAVRGAAEVLARGKKIELSAIQFLPPVRNPQKIVCIGLNYADHSAETGLTPPEYPAVFVRFNSTLVGHLAPIVRPRLSEQLDYEGELVAVIGKGGRHIAKSAALEHVAGYSLFNDASVRDFQFKSGQWTMGKNFDATGAFGSEFITADELPPGCKGLRFETHLNGRVLQKASIDNLIFDVATLVSLLSDAFSFVPGDILITGTPGGVGLARKPPLWMKPGDVCTITSKDLGELSNPIVAEA